MPDITVSAKAQRPQASGGKIRCIRGIGRFHMDYGIAIPNLLQQQRPQVNIRRLTTMTVSRRSTIDLRLLQAENIADDIRFFAPAPLRHALAQ